jgi:YidC/Oxa1 family membrane protein insertase
MDQKNFIVAIVLSVLIIVGWQVAFPPSKQATQNGQQQASTTTPAGAPTAPTGPNGTQPGPGSVPAQQPVVSRSEAVALTPRVTFSTPELVGSISLKGARIDDVQLVKYRETIDPKSPPVPVLSPIGSKSPYYAEFGWSA